MKKFLLVIRSLGVGLLLFLIIFTNTCCANQEGKTYNVYFAGDLFDQKHLTGNALLAEAIERSSDGLYNCMLPQDWEGAFNNSVDIRNKDIQLLMQADLVIFNFDGVDLDSGTVVEFMIAKMLDIPCVLLRTDSRNGGHTLGDDWNLMVLGYPRCSIVKNNAFMIYNDVGLEGMHTAIAKDIVASFGNLLKEKSLFDSKQEASFAYNHVIKMCGSGLDKIVTSDILDEIFESKMEKSIYSF